MSGLAQMQAGIRDLLKNRQAGAPSDPYLQKVASSRGFAAIQEIAIWWRTFQLESYCQWTGRLLKRLGVFEETVKKFYFQNAVSPFIEVAGEDFLEMLSVHENPLIAGVAQFERAVSRAKKGDPEEYCVAWDRNPEEIFRSLVHGVELPAAEAGVVYRIKISGKTPGFISCSRLAQSSTSAASQVASPN